MALTGLGAFKMETSETQIQWMLLSPTNLVRLCGVVGGGASISFSCAGVRSPFPLLSDSLLRECVL